MRNKLLIIVTFFCFFSVFSSCAAPEDMETSPIIMNELSGTDLYTQAIEKLQSSKNFGISIDIQKIITIQDQTITEHIKSGYVYENYAENDVRVSLNETVIFPSNTLHYTQQFANNTVFLQLNSSLFRSEVDFNEYKNTLIPIQLLDPEIYTDYSIHTNNGRTLIAFHNAMSTEKWLFPHQPHNLTAFGTAILDSDEKLIKTTYTAQWEYQGIHITYIIHSTPIETMDSITPPQYADGYTQIQSISSPILLTKSANLLLSTQQIHSETEHSVSSEASGLRRKQHISMFAEYTKDDFQADIITDISLYDSTRSGSITTVQQREQFCDSRYILEAEGEIKENTSVSKDEMVGYCKNILLDTILTSDQIVDVEVKTHGTDIICKYTLTQELIDAIRLAACQTLYQDPSALDDVADDKETVEVSYIIRIDALTGLPIATSIQSRFHYTINDNIYSLTSETTQNFYLVR